MSLPSRVTRQIHRLESQNLVGRCSSPDDGRGVLATITPEGRALLKDALVTYGDGVRTHFLGRLSRTQIAAMGRTADASALGFATPRRPRDGSGLKALGCPTVAWQSGLMHSP